jgi:HK97 family phage major capsid protein
MKTMTQYREDIANLMKAAGDIDAKCITENRDPLDSEVALKNEIMDTVEETKRILSSMERQERIAKELSKPQDAVTREKTIPKQKEVRDKDRFSSFGEQLASVINAGRPGGSIDPRLRIKAAATGLGESVAADGGFLVQQDFSNELLQDTIETGIIAPKCRKMQISSNSNSMKLNGVDETSRASSRSGGIIAYWKDEAALKVASKPKFRQIELNLHKLIGLCYATDELLADAAALESFIRAEFPKEFRFQIDDAIISGTGAGQPMGILNAGCLVSVPKEAGQEKQTILAQNVEKMWSRMFAGSLPSAEWYINQNTYPQLFQMSHAVGLGGIPVFLPPGGLSVAPYGALFGRPVTPIEQCSTLGTLGDIIFADFRNGYIIAEKGGIQTDVSIHVQFLYDEQIFRFVLRLDGQTVRATPLTPFKGSETLSHFVALATRA